MCMVENTKAASFESHRTRLFAIAYRMLGVRAEAEDVLQEVYLRWHQTDTAAVQSPIALLITITTRLCLDRLRQLKQERERCVRPVSSEPVAKDEVASERPSPEAQLELSQDVAAAFLTTLERLGPGERSAFLLHDVFDYDYAEVAQVVGKAEPTCRQMVHRARERVREPRARFSVTPESRKRALGKFIVAARTGDRSAIAELLAEELEYVGHPPVDTFVVRRQRPHHDLPAAPLHDSVVCGAERSSMADAARSQRDQSGGGYVCPGWAQKRSDRGSGGVYEMDNETYEATRVG